MSFPHVNITLREKKDEVENFSTFSTPSLLYNTISISIAMIIKI